MRSRHFQGYLVMVDPIVSRRFPFHAGSEIRLADGRDWIFPDPLWDTLPKHSQPPLEYLELLDVILKTQDSAERYLSELALAIFLLWASTTTSRHNSTNSCLPLHPNPET